MEPLIVSNSSFATITKIDENEFRVNVPPGRTILFSLGTPGSEPLHYLSSNNPEFFIHGKYTEDLTDERATITLHEGSYHCRPCEEWCPDCQHSRMTIR